MPQIDEIEGERRHYSYRVTLRVRHPDCDPQEITSALGIQPKWTWRAGEPRRTLKGAPLNGVYPHTYWYSTLCNSEYNEQSLSDALSDCADQVSPFAPFFETVKNAGGHVEFFVGWSLYHNSGDTFEPELLARLGRLHIALSFDVYNLESQPIEAGANRTGPSSGKATPEENGRQLT